MKTVLLAILILTIGCGKGGSGSSVVAPKNPTSPGQSPSKNNYRIVVTGDATMQMWFSSNSFDVDVGYAGQTQTGFPGNINIAAGGSYELDITAYNIQNLVIQENNNPPYFNGNGMVCYNYAVYKNTVLVENHSLCSSAFGAYQTFNNW